LVILIATLGELCGSLLAFGIGRYGGREIVDRYGKYLLVTTADVDRAEQFFARHGAPVVVFGRLVPVIRSFVSFGPGLARMSIRRFSICSALGCAIWCSTLACIGFALGRSWHQVLREFRYAGYVAIALVIGLGLFALGRRINALRAERAVG
jgi:membrane protein DedA with SNARE-associated domain